MLGDVSAVWLLNPNHAHLLSCRVASFLRYAAPVVFLHIELPK